MKTSAQRITLSKAERNKLEEVASFQARLNDHTIYLDRSGRYLLDDTFPEEGPLAVLTEEQIIGWLRGAAPYHWEDKLIAMVRAATRERRAA